MDAAPTRPPEPPSTASYAAAAAGAALLVLIVVAGWPDAELPPQTVWFAQEASLDDAQAAGGPPTALSLTGLADDFVFDPPGRLVERPDGVASLIGVVRRAADPKVAFAVDVTLSGRIEPDDPTHPPAGSPSVELLPEAYADQGGPADPATWRYYPELEGTLTGLDAMAGARLAVSRGGPAAQVGAGASGRSTDLGGAAALRVVLELPPAAGTLPPLGSGHLRFDLLAERRLCATDGVQPPVPLLPASHTLSLDGLADRLVFASPGHFLERQDGTASLSGVVLHAEKPSKGFFVELELAGRVDPGHPQHPPGPDSTTTPSLGTDPAAWTYFSEVDGKLTGLGGWKGGKLKLSRRDPPPRLGAGASDTDLGLGLSVRFVGKTTRTPPNAEWPKKIDGELNASLGGCRTCSADPSPTKLAKDPMHASMSLPGFAEDLIQLVPGRLVERTDGTARFDAALARASNPDAMLHLELELTDRIERGDPGHPPDELLALGLKKKAHRKKAGPAFPAFWTYFGGLDGRLTGLGSWSGVEIDLVHHGVFPQIGFGASGESQGYGGTVPFAWALTPPLTPSQSVASAGELRFRLDADCEAVGAGLPVPFGPACAPPAGPAPELAVLGVPGLGPLRLSIRHGPPGGLAFLVVGTGRGDTTLPTGCLLLVDSVHALLGPSTLDGDGGLEVDVLGTGYLAPSTLTLQAAVWHPAGPATTAGVELTIP